jgi:Ca2+ transporting ATPase
LAVYGAFQLHSELTHFHFFSPVNVFSGILNNRIFCGILLTTAVLQALIVEFGSLAFHVAENGLDAKYWGLSLLLGFGALPVQQVINVFYRVGQHYKGIRMRKRIAKDGAMTTMRANGTHSHRD